MDQSEVNEYLVQYESKAHGEFVVIPMKPGSEQLLFNHPMRPKGKRAWRIHNDDGEVSLQEIHKKPPYAEWRSALEQVRTAMYEHHLVDEATTRIAQAQGRLTRLMERDGRG